MGGTIRSTGLLALFMLSAFLWGVHPAVADIYRFQDENGVWRYTNIKNDSRYRLFIKSREEKAIEYIDKYSSIIEQASNMFNVDSSLIKAVIKAESAFNHRAVSHKGAQGLMQLMPATADLMRVNDPFDPTENIFGGTKYLSGLLDRFGHNMELAVAAYNAGPEAVVRNNGIPPYQETRIFVRRVIRYYNGYLSQK
ncbi:MAG: lytic transglycosylase domain-containing protein [Thermodesulfobacteriota bacterium]